MFKTIFKNIHNKTFRSSKVIENKIFVECFYGREFSGDIRYLSLKLQKLGIYKIHVVYYEEGLKDELIKNNFIPLKLESKEYFEVFYSSKYIISNLNLYKMLNKSSEQIFIQTWHGFPIKNMVLELQNKKERKKQSNEFTIDMKAWDFILSASDFYINELQNSFGDLKDFKLIKSVAPRIEFLLKNYKKEKENIILYAPTWRSYDKKSNKLDLEKVAKETGYRIWVKPHTHDKSFKGLYKNSNLVEVYNECYNIYDLLNEVDILITDLSSVMFDFLTINNKLILHSWDFEKYKEEIGLKYPTSTFGNYEIKNYSETELIEIITAQEFGEKNEEFIQNNVIGNYEYLDLSKSELL